MNSILSTRRLTVLSTLVVALAVVDQVLRPDRAAFWLLSVAVLIPIWVLALAQVRRARRDGVTFDGRSLLKGGEWGAALAAVGLAIGLSKALGFEDGWMAERGLGVATGAMLLAMGNALPKYSSKAGGPCAARDYGARRFAGWAFAIAGAVNLGAWLFTSIEDAWSLGVVATASATIVVLTRVAYCASSPLHSTRPKS
jgi:hypothetical protein